MMSLAARSGVFSPYLQATNYAVAGPLKALIPGVVVKGEKVLVDTKKPFLTRESLNGQSPKTGPAVSVSINDHQKILQLHHREHPDGLHHCLVCQLLGLRPQGTTEGSAYGPVHHQGQASCHPG
uniref:Ubiquinol-cytochrome c reductase iron-sulphur subunit N-terminal domain-containing protein n=1 Tax=Oncorhynchus tshawytscha TaxID=74940 RepID=A0A8C8H9J2_ONCTS